MLKSVTVINGPEKSLLLTLANPEASGYLVTDITGLGPQKANINISKNATTDGGTFNSASIGERNIVITLMFQEEFSAEDLRQKTYDHFPVKKQLQLKFITDNRTCIIDGVVESNEPIIFSDQCGTQISIICAKPFFRSEGEGNITTLYGITPMFEFPFSNESLTESLLEFGSVSTIEKAIIKYSGDADIGVEIFIKANGPATKITLYNVLTAETMVIDTDRLKTITGKELIAGDEITINTRVGQKRITLLRDGVTINILACLGRFSKWLQLSKGDNVFSFSAETGRENLLITIKNEILYEGV